MIKNIHDNKIISYSVDFRDNKISFTTINSRNEIIKIIFYGTLAHQFKMEMPNSILLDIECSNGINMIEENTELLEQTKDYSWPIGYNNVEQLREKLINEKYSYYTISSSLGLFGWITAKEMEIC